MMRLSAVAAVAYLLAAAPAFCDSPYRDRPVSSVSDLEARLRASTSVADGVRFVRDGELPDRWHAVPVSRPWQITCGDTLEITFAPDVSVTLAEGPITEAQCHIYSLALARLL